jgi:hypothetical protein
VTMLEVFRTTNSAETTVWTMVRIFVIRHP